MENNLINYSNQMNHSIDVNYYHHKLFIDINFVKMFNLQLKLVESYLNLILVIQSIIIHIKITMFLYLRLDDYNALLFFLIVKINYLIFIIY